MTHSPLADFDSLGSSNVGLSSSPVQVMQVLVVEDHPPIRHAMNRLMVQAGFGVSLAGSVEEGMAMLDGKDCLLLDLNLPDGCGIKLLRHVREKKLPLRVAVITATGDSQLLREVNELKPDALFLKPIEIAQVLAWIERIPQSSHAKSNRPAQRREAILTQVAPNFSWHMRWPRVGK